MLTAVVAANPEPYAHGAVQFQGLDATYIKSLLYGFREALKAQRLFSWGSVLSLGEWTIRQPRNDVRERGWGGDRDPHWGWARKALADLLEEGLKGAGRLPFDLRVRVWHIIHTLASDPDPSPEEEKEEGSFDPATRAINTVRGEAMHALMQYALWCARNLHPEGPKETVSYETAREIPEVQTELDKHLDSSVDRSLAIRSVYGQFFPWLVLLDQSWARTRMMRIFSQDPSERDLRDAAWDAYVTFCPVYDNVVPILMSEYERAVSALPRDKSRSGLAEPDESLAEHVLVLYIRGFAPFGEGGLVETFFVYTIGSEVLLTVTVSIVMYLFKPAVFQLIALLNSSADFFREIIEAFTEGKEPTSSRPGGMPGQQTPFRPPPYPAAFRGDPNRFPPEEKK